MRHAGESRCIWKTETRTSSVEQRESSPGRCHGVKDSKAVLSLEFYLMAVGQTPHLISA